MYGDSPNAYDKAKELYAKLNENECKPWMDEEGLEHGVVPAEGTFRAIKQCDFFIPITTCGYATSLWCLRELYYAVLNEKTIIPMLLEEEDVVNNEKAGKWLMRIGKVQKCFNATEVDAMIVFLKAKVLPINYYLSHGMT